MGMNVRSISEWQDASRRLYLPAASALPLTKFMPFGSGLPGFLAEAGASKCSAFQGWSLGTRIWAT